MIKTDVGIYLSNAAQESSINFFAPIVFRAKYVNGDAFLMPIASWRDVANGTAANCFVPSDISATGHRTLA
jgi:hypothetical protein